MREGAASNRDTRQTHSVWKYGRAPDILLAPRSLTFSRPALLGTERTAKRLASSVASRMMSEDFTGRRRGEAVDHEVPTESGCSVRECALCSIRPPTSCGVETPQVPWKLGMSARGHLEGPASFTGETKMKTQRSWRTALLLLLPFLALDSSAAVISGSWSFSGTNGGNSFGGTFSFVNLDTTLTYTDSVAAGFSLTTNFDTSGNGGNAFSYDPGALRIGGLAQGVDAASGALNDWIFFTPDFLTGEFIYFGSTGVSGLLSVVVSPNNVPEPGPLGLGTLAAVAIGCSYRARRPK